MFETTIATLATVSGERPYIAVLCSTGWLNADIWARSNLDMQSVTVLWPAMFNRSTSVQPWPIAGAVFLDAEAFHSSDYGVLLECLKPAAHSAGLSPSSLVYIAYTENHENLYYRMRKELVVIGLDSYLSFDSTDGSIYFRYDTDEAEDNPIKENESKYFDISEDLRSMGYEIKDPQIEHDCISGTITPICKAEVEKPQELGYMYVHNKAFYVGKIDRYLGTNALLGARVLNLVPDILKTTWSFELEGHEGTFISCSSSCFAYDTPKNRKALQAYIQADKNVHAAETERLIALNAISLMGDKC